MKHIAFIAFNVIQIIFDLSLFFIIIKYINKFIINNKTNTNHIYISNFFTFTKIFLKIFIINISLSK